MLGSATPACMSHDAPPLTLYHIYHTHTVCPRTLAMQACGMPAPAHASMPHDHLTARMARMSKWASSQLATTAFDHSHRVPISRTLTTGASMTSHACLDDSNTSR